MDVEALLGFRENRIPLVQREGFVTLVFEEGDATAVVVIAHPAFKGRARARFIGPQRVA